MGMITEELLNHFDGVKKTGTDQWKALNPLGDKNPSLSITADRKNGKTLLHAFNGGTAEEILAAVGLKTSDLFYPGTGSGSRGRSWQEKTEEYLRKKSPGITLRDSYTYSYTESGEYAFTKIRLLKEDGEKDFRYGTLNDDRDYLKIGLNGKKRADIPVAVYGSVKKILESKETDHRVCYCEGERDVETLLEYGLLAFTAGSAKDGESEAERFAPLTAGADLVIFSDNDDPGRKSSAAVFRACQKFAKTAKIIVPMKEEPKADISDFMKTHTLMELMKLIKEADDTKEVLDQTKQTAADKTKDTHKIKLKTVAEYEEREVEWLIPNFIPKEQITILAGDGGAGKTFAVSNIIAAVTTGKKSIFEEQIPFPKTDDAPKDVMFFSGEDTISEVLKRRLIAAGADVSRVATLSLEDDDFTEIILGTSVIEELIADYRPALVVLDPLESFLPEKVQMNSRNAMRALTKPLTAMGKKYGTAFIIVMHTNKLGGVWGRRRIADSADMWDISRSVFLFGKTKDGMFYCSHEKSNNSDLQQTILYRIENGEEGTRAVYFGTSQLKDREFVLEAERTARENRSQKGDVAEYIIQVLSEVKDEPMPMRDLEDACEACGFSKNAIREAKAELSKKKRISIYNTGYGNEKKFFVKLT